MTTQRNPAHADEEPGVAGPDTDPSAVSADDDTPDPEGPREAVERGDETEGTDPASDGRDGWGGYVVPPTAGTDAGWAPPTGDAWPPSRPVGPPASSYPALRRAVDLQSGTGAEEAGEERDEPAAAAGWRTRGGSPAAPAGDTASGAPEGEGPERDASGSTTGARGWPAAVGWRTRDGASGPSEHAAPEGPGADGEVTPAGWRGPGGAAERATEPGSSTETDRARPERAEEAARARERLRTPEKGGGRHAARAQPRDDEHDEELAQWVGSLAEAVDPDDQIAGRRTGPMPVVSAETRARAGTGAGDNADAGSDDEGAGTDRRADTNPGTSDGAAASSGPGHHARPTTGAATTEGSDPAGADTSAGAPADAPTGGASETDAATAPGDGAPDRSAPDPSEDDTDSVGGADSAPITGVPTLDDIDDADGYQPATYEWEPMPATTREELIARLDALAAIVRIGRDDFDPPLIEDARHVLEHAGTRLRLSGDHTVVALAGGTGSGKSSLFNALCGLEFSRVGITRPTTSAAHACVWGNEGADGILDWLDVPHRNRHSRTSVLDKDETDLMGLILLDLPDHDSVRAMHTAEAERLIGAVDLLVWVLDPQKYADAAVHHRYLAEMSGYGAVTVAVLNQVDRVEPEELEELLTDLRRLLETESGVHPRVLTTSTLTGQGVRGLRDLLNETVVERRALVDRLVADLDRVIDGFTRYRGPDPADLGVPDSARRRVVTDLLEASGVPAIAASAESTHERRGARRVGWPVTRWVRKLRRDPLRAVQMDFLRDSAGEGSLSGPVEAQRAEIETAAAQLADEAGGELPAPWPRRVRAASREHLDELPSEVGRTVAATVPDPADTPSWWQVVRALHYVLIIAAGAGLAWCGALITSRFTGGTGLALLDDPLFIGFAAAVVVVTLAAGWLTDVGCRNLVSVAAAQRREHIEQQSFERLRTLAEERIAAPVERELARYREFTEALTTALGENEHDGR